MSIKKQEKGKDYSDIIIWTAGLVGMIRYSAAFLSSDLGKIVGITSEVITVLLGVSGFAMGLLATFGATYLFDGWRRKMPASGTKWPFKFVVLTIFIAFIFASELMILVPFTVSRMAHASMTEVLNGGVWWWSFAVNVMPLLLIGGVSVGNQVVTVSSESSAESLRKVSEEEGKVSDKFPKDWRKLRPTLTDDQVKGMAESTTKDICYYYSVDARTARNWRDYARKEVVVVNSQEAK